MSAELLTSPAAGSAEWHKERQNGIGASEAAAILGLSKYATPLEVYLQKTLPPAEIADTKETRRGRRFESFVLDMYEEDFGELERNIPRVTSPTHPFMFANLDARWKRDKRPVDAKTVGQFVAHLWGDPGTDAVPQEYVIQMHHQMKVTGAEISDLAVLKNIDNFSRYTIALDKELAEMIVAAEADFWRRVENREPPPPIDEGDLAIIFRTSKEDVIEATEEIAQKFLQLAEAKKNAKALKKNEASLLFDIKKFLGEKDTLLIKGERVATWKSSKPTQKFEAEKFAADHPELYARYLTETPGSRQFLFK
jgi:putative phage-type endonuclease